MRVQLFASEELLSLVSAHILHIF